MASDLKATVFMDLERELEVTRKVLGAVPEGKESWKPHEKSMSLGQLAIHIATMPGWMLATIAGDTLDTASAPRMPREYKDVAELLGIFDKTVAGLREKLAAFDMANWDKMWTMRNGEQVIVTKARPFVWRVWDVNHMIHHRGQLALYLRLLDVKVPTIYFNTADDPKFVFE